MNNESFIFLERSEVLSLIFLTEFILINLLNIALPGSLKLETILLAASYANHKFSFILLPTNS
ncbi:hypothetical protein oki361_23460 [Helicobacter pylori]